MYPTVRFSFSIYMDGVTKKHNERVWLIMTKYNNGTWKAHFYLQITELYEYLELEESISAALFL